MANSPDDAPGVMDAVRYVAAPRFSAAREPVDLEGLRHLMALFFSTALAVVVVSEFLGPIVISGLGGELPRNVNEDLLDMNPGRLVLIGIVLAPVIEEGLFRSWLGSRRLTLFGLPVLSVGTVLLMASGASGAVLLPVMAVLGFLLTVFILRAVRLDPGERAAARDGLFPWIFWGSGLLFALIHLSNFDGGLTSPWLLLAVVPQGLVGLVLGYVRMRYGLAPAIGFHGAYNALFLSLGLLGQGLADSAPPPAVTALLF